MAAPGRKRDISDFFKSYARSVPDKSSASSVDEDTIVVAQPDTKSTIPGTPKNAKRIRNAPEVQVKSLFGTPRRAISGSIPIRSPSASQTPQAVRKRQLFTRQEYSTSLPGQPIPLSTFGDITHPEHEIPVKTKRLEIRDSDGDDSESLASLDDIFGRNKEDGNTSSSSPPEAEEARVKGEKIRSISSFTNARSQPIIGKEALRALYARERVHKFDISALLGEHFDDQEIEANVSKARAGYETSMLEADTDRKNHVDKNLLASIVHVGDKDDDEFSRLMNAVERTEALTSERTFSFFGSEGLNSWHADQPPMPDFPVTEIPGQSKHSDDEGVRSRAFLSGYMTEAVGRGALAEAALDWTLDVVIKEPQDDLRQAYIHCLAQASKTWTRTKLTASDVQDMFRSLGAALESIRDGTVVTMRSFSPPVQLNSDTRFLVAALDTFRAICQDLDFEAMSKLTSILTRLILDDRVMCDGLVSRTVEETISKLLALPDRELRNFVAERILSDCSRNLQEPLWQAKMLSHILATSSTAARLRVDLANAFLFGAGLEDEKKDDASHVSLSRLTHHITHSPSFQTTRHSRIDPIDYSALTSRTHILDAAISDGGRPYPFASRADELKFNNSVDELAVRLETIITSIADSGASHMRRTEAKDVLQALRYRLLFSVRTEPRPKKTVFDIGSGKSRNGQEARIELRGKDFMQKFLVKKQEQELEQVASATNEMEEEH